MSNTLVYSARVGVDNHKWVLGYQNQASNYTGMPNAMILPVPSKRKINQEDFLPVDEKYKSWLTDYAKADQPRTLGADDDGLVAAAAGGVIETFKVGSYKVSTCPSPAVLGIVLRTAGLPAPAFLLDKYRERYSGWPLLICQWDGSIEAEPLLLTYDALPEWSEDLFVPMLDSHDGRSFPAKVDRDHTLIVARETAINKTLDRQPSRSLDPRFPHNQFFPWFKQVFHVNTFTKNGDARLKFKEGRTDFVDNTSYF